MNAMIGRAHEALDVLHDVLRIVDCRLQRDLADDERRFVDEERRTALWCGHPSF
jgi:hypothetical protein